MAQRRSELTLFRLFGAPVLVHWTVLLIVLLALLFSRDPLVLSAGFAAYLSLILVHEIGHACIARLNRLRVHELLVFPLHGWCRYQAGRTRGQDIAVAWGGVAAQAVLFAVAVALSILAPNPGGPFGPALAAIVLVWGPLNLLNIVVNLLPIAPFDGHTAWGVLPWGLQRIRASLLAPAKAPAAKQPPAAEAKKSTNEKVVSLSERRKRR